METLLPAGDGTHYLVVKQEIREQIHAAAGSLVQVVMAPDPEERTVTVPADLTASTGDTDDQPQASYCATQRKGWCPVKIDDSKYDSSGQLKNGLFEEHFKDGTLSCVGEYINGEKAGEWKYYFRNGMVQAIGRYSNGKLIDKWTWYRQNGQLMQTGTFEEEKKVGLWKRYHPNGALYDEGQYINDKKVGEWRIYDSNGNLSRTTYHKGH